MNIEQRNFNEQWRKLSRMQKAQLIFLVTAVRALMFVLAIPAMVYLFCTRGSPKNWGI